MLWFFLETINVNRKKLNFFFIIIMFIIMNNQLDWDNHYKAVASDINDLDDQLKYILNNFKVDKYDWKIEKYQCSDYYYGHWAKWIYKDLIVTFLTDLQEKELAISNMKDYLQEELDTTDLSKYIKGYILDHASVSELNDAIGYNYEDADGETFGILYTTDNKEYNVYVDVIKELSWTINQDGDETLDLSN